MGKFAPPSRISVLVGPVDEVIRLGLATLGTEFDLCHSRSDLAALLLGAQNLGCTVIIARRDEVAGLMPPLELTVVGISSSSTDVLVLRNGSTYQFDNPSPIQLASILRGTYFHSVPEPKHSEGTE